MRYVRETDLDRILNIAEGNNENIRSMIESCMLESELHGQAPMPPAGAGEVAFPMIDPDKKGALPLISLASQESITLVVDDMPWLIWKLLRLEVRAGENCDYLYGRNLSVIEGLQLLPGVGWQSLNREVHTLRRDDQKVIAPNKLSLEVRNMGGYTSTFCISCIGSIVRDDAFGDPYGPFGPALTDLKTHRRTPF